MQCAACKHENRQGRKFCVECGAALAQRCPRCGSACEPTEKFCGECGAALRAGSGPGVQGSGTRSPEPRTLDPEPGAADGAAHAEARKIVTIVFADLVGSTSLHERLDAEAVRQFMEGYYAAMRGAVEAHSGRVTQVMGDGVKAVFGAPQVGEDDAIRAVRAAVAMQQAFRTLAEQQRGRVGETGLRVAVNTGEVVAKEGQEIIGDPVNVAARLQQEAGNGEVVIGAATQRLVGSLVTLDALGTFALKGRTEKVRAYRVVSLERPAGAATVPFVGRQEELARITAVYDGAVATPAARLAVLVGSPGLGKSRLISEVGQRLGDTATVLSAHCDAAGGATFAPIAEALRKLLSDGRSDLSDQSDSSDPRAAIDALLLATGPDLSPEGLPKGDRARIAGGISALLAGSPAPPQETFFVLRRLLTGMARTQPVVLVIDDLQWAEPLLLDLVEHLIQWGSGVPLLVLVGARPELRELRSSLVTPGGLVADVITLSGLDAGPAMRLAANVIGAADLPAALAAKVLATSEGNPLFVGELVRMLVQEGTLTKEGDRWKVAVEIAHLEMPPTIHALLAARIERLRAEERTVLERAAVIGRQFSRSAVAALLPTETADLDARIESLRRSDLIERATGWFLGEPVLRFHHVLIRDAAYRRLLKGTRAELHEHVADWIASRAGDEVEHDETIGHHLEQAHQLLGELGPIDAHGREIGERAARHLADAGRRALARDDVPVAADLLGRALDRLEPSDATRAELALDWCEALLAAGDVTTAARAIEELARWAGARDKGRGTREESDLGLPANSSLAPRPSPLLRFCAWHTCFTGQLTVMTAPQELQATADAVAQAAADFAKLGDAAGEAKAHFVQAQALARLGKVGACEAALDKALAAARTAGDRRRANAVLAGAPLAALWGPSPVTRASGRCLDVVRVLRITQGAPAVEAVALSCQGVLEALRGRTDAARRMIASSRKMVEDLGIANRLFEADVFAGRVDLLEGDAAAAEHNLRRAYEGLRDLGLGIDAARAGALLGRALLERGEVEEAEKLTHESERLAGDDLQAAIAWRGVRAEALARRGMYAEAVELAQAAVAIAATTDALLDHAAARMALAAALRTAGRTVEAVAEEQRARELWSTKGATVLAEGRRRDDGGVARAVPAAPTHERGWRRRIRPNAASAAMAGLEAAFRARDLDAIGALLGDPMENVDHPNGTRYGREAQLEACARMLRTARFELRVGALATLGESLCLSRRFVTGRGTAGGRFDVAEYEMEHVTITEIGDDGRFRRLEVFAAEHLNDAIAAFYERHAELLPEGPARERAAATAHSLSAFLETFNLDRIASAIAPAIEFVDHRSLVTLGSLRGSEALLEVLRSLIELTDGFGWRVDDILGATDRAILARHNTFGTDRASGGAFERTFLELLVFGADGLLERLESFDTDDEAEALKRFDELAVDPTAAAVPRRVRPNAVTAALARIAAAMAARDLDARRAALSEDYEEIHHPTGATYGRDQNLAYIERLFRSPGVISEYTPLATLGERLGLDRRLIGASANRGGRFDVGEWTNEVLTITEVDQNGLIRRWEMFAPNHLGAALVRLYERYAESLPAGAERERAGAIAGSIAELVSASDASNPTSALGPAVEVVDHRLVGFGTLRGAKAVDAWNAMLALAVDLEVQFLDVLAAVPEAMVVKAMMSGHLRDGGGAFERSGCLVLVFGTDGRIARYEQFEADREAEALARFEAHVTESTSPSPVRRRVRPNAATASQARFDALFAARDLDAIATLYRPDYSEIDHPTGSSYGRDGTLASLRGLLRSRDPSFRHEPLATLGDALALSRRRLGARATGGARFDVGEYEDEKVCVQEVDERGQTYRYEVFAPEHLGEAIARLYELHAEQLPAGPQRERAEATAAVSASSTAALAPVFDLERFAASLAPDIECIDRRLVRAEPIHGAEAFVHALLSLQELGQDMTYCIEDVLALRPDAILGRYSNSGTERVGGGLYERPFLGLGCYGPEGRLARLEFFDVGQEAVALARFDELVVSSDEGLTGAAQPPLVRRRVRENAATAMQAKFDAAIAARDFDSMASVYSESFETIEHPTGSTYGADAAVASLRRLFRSRDASFHIETLATLGPSLLLSRRRVGASGTAGGRYDVGEYESEAVQVQEVDAHGLCSRVEAFAPDRLGQAVARLYARYAELLPEGPARTRAAVIARRFLGPEPSDAGALAATLTPSVQSIDHRLVGSGVVRGREAVVRAAQTLADLSTELRFRLDDVLALADDATLLRVTNSGKARDGGGAFEREICVLRRFADDGRITHWEIFDADHESEALARFDELVLSSDEGLVLSSDEGLATTASEPPLVWHRVRENAATAVQARFETAVAARDFDAMRSIYSDCFEAIEHPTGSTYGPDGVVASFQRFFRSRDASFSFESLATLGPSLLLFRRRASASGTGGGRYDVGEYESEALNLMEVDAQGLCSRVETFAADRLGDAVACLFGRYAELLPEGTSAEGLPEAGSERDVAAATARAVTASLQAFDIDNFVRVLDPNVESVDHRLLGSWSGRGAEVVAQHFRAMRDVAENPVARIDDVLALEPAMFLARWTGSGTTRAGGGAYERVFLALWVAGKDGLVKRVEFFDVGREAEALARFDELVGLPAGPEVDRSPLPVLGRSLGEGGRGDHRGVERPAAQHRVPANTASVVHARIGPLLRARDFDGLLAMFSETYQEIHHPTGSSYGRAETVASMQRLFRSQDATYESEPLATLGSSLILSRTRVGARATGGGRFDVGAYETEMITVMEVDERGLFTHEEVFAADHLGDAIVFLYRCHAEQLPAGGESERAMATAHAVAGLMRPLETERFAASLAPGYQAVDHRVLGTWSARGPEAMLAHLRSMLEVATDVVIRQDDVLALGPHALLTHTIHSGTAPEGGGAYERPYLMINVFGSGGLVERAEFFDVGNEAEALARFDEIVGSSGSEIDQGRFERSPSALFQNAATRLNERIVRAWAARDWNAVTACHSPACDFDDRRPLMRMRTNLADAASMLFEVPNGRWTVTPVATRGERLALSRVVFRGDVDQDGGPLTIDYVIIDEVGDDGRLIASVSFDPGDLDAAYAELDRRYEAGEGASHPEPLALIVAFREAFEARDFDRIIALCAPTFVRHDRRRIAVLEAAGPAAWIQNLSALFDLAPDTDIRYDHLECGDHGYLFLSSWHGTREGGDFEIPFLGVIETDGSGKFARIDVYDPEQVDEARARFAELDEPRAVQERFANVATRSLERAMAILAARDYESWMAEHAPDFKAFDRRSHVQLELDIREWLAGMREIVELTSEPPVLEVLATRGERLALARLLWTGEQGDVGPSEIETLIIGEADDSGKHRAAVYFDPGDLDAAYAELDARWAAGEGTACRAAVAWVQGVPQAIDRRDWDALGSFVAPDSVSHDHRLVGPAQGGPAAVVRAVQAMVELAPDARIRQAHVRALGQGLLSEIVWIGTRDGGVFENPFLSVVELDVEGRALRFDFFDTRHLQRALARFEEIVSKDVGSTQHRFSNAATRCLERAILAARDRDFEAFAALHAPDFRQFDRRSHVQAEFDGEEWLAETRKFVEMTSEPPVLEVLATRGTHLALAHILWRGAEGDVGPSEVEMLNLGEVDDSGKSLTAVYYFDPDDLDAAYAELDARWEAGEGAAFPAAVAWAQGVPAAIARRDLDALRSFLAADLVSHDYRLVSLGMLMGPADLVRAVEAMVELAPDARVRLAHVRAHGRGLLFEAAWVGTYDGGAFENPFFSVVELGVDGRACRWDIFDFRHPQRALARFEEIGGGPSPFDSPSEPFINSAPRAAQRGMAAIAARDWEGFCSLFATDFRNFDRRRMFQIESDRERYLGGFRHIVEMTSSPPEWQVLATLGDRLVLVHMLWRGEEGDVGPSEIDWLLIIEVNDRGEHTAVVTLDPDDLDAAYDEIDARYTAGEGAAHPVAKLRQEFSTALDRRDWDGLASLCAPEMVGYDHRLVGWGTLRGPDAFLKSIRAMVELAPDVRARINHFRATERAAIMEGAWQGTREGGGFESPSIEVFELDADGKTLRIDIYDPHKVEAAFARFEEIEATAARVSPFANAASRASDRQAAYWKARDWDGLEGTVTEGFRFHDRRGLSHLELGREEVMAYTRSLGDMPSRSVATELVATRGDRLALARWRLEVAGGDVGPSEICHLNLYETDERGAVKVMVRWEADDLDAAYAEIDARFAAAEGEVHPLAVAWMQGFGTALGRRDWDALASCIAPNSLRYDHRLVGFETLRGPAAFVEATRAMVELAPDVRLRIDHVRASRRGLITDALWIGTREGGAFESPFLGVVELNTEGRAQRVDQYDEHRLDDAFARFAEIGEGSNGG